MPPLDREMKKVWPNEENRVRRKPPAIQRAFLAMKLPRDCMCRRGGPVMEA
jgi:hypothetical protein